MYLRISQLEFLRKLLLDIPFAWPTLHRLALKLTDRIGLPAISTGFYRTAVVWVGITFDLVGYQSCTRRFRAFELCPTFFLRHSSQARDAFERFLLSPAWASS
jgi:hypothetical protein